MITPSYSTCTINYVPKEIAEMRWQVLYPSSCISVTDKYNVLFFWSDPKTMSGQGRSWMNPTNGSSISTASFAIKAQNVLGFRVPSLLLKFLYAIFFTVALGTFSFKSLAAQMFPWNLLVEPHLFTALNVWADMILILFYSFLVWFWLTWSTLHPSFSSRASLSRPKRAAVSTARLSRSARPQPN